jgi:gas vesicle protein
MKKGDAFLGLLTGMAIGAILGVLFAPAKGSETRRKLSDKGNEYAESLKKKFDGFIDDLIDGPTSAQEKGTGNSE